MALLQQLMQVATQPSPVKAIFTEADVELASVVLLQHLIASCRNTAVTSHRPADSTCPPPTTDPDDVERHARGAANSDTAALMGNYDTHLYLLSADDPLSRTFSGLPLTVKHILLECTHLRHETQET